MPRKEGGEGRENSFKNSAQVCSSSRWCAVVVVVMVVPSSSSLSFSTIFPPTPPFPPFLFYFIYLCRLCVRRLLWNAMETVVSPEGTFRLLNSPHRHTHTQVRGSVPRSSVSLLPVCVWIEEEEEQQHTLRRDSTRKGDLSC